MSNGKGGFIGQDGLNAPDEPTGVSASGVGSSLSVAFTAPSNEGAAAITGYRAQAGSVGTSGTSSPLAVTGLTAGTSYNVSVWAINAFGYSAPSNSVSASPAGARGVFAGGYADESLNVIDYITVATDGNASDFGDLTRTTAFFPGGTSSSTRGIFSGGMDGGSGITNVIDYITISSTGNATDFGNLSVASKAGHAHASTTRGVIILGATAAAPNGLNTIEYITIANTGNTTDFGNLSALKIYGASCASPTRGVILIGGATNTIEYITIANTGNTTDFGNLVTTTENGAGGISSETRGVFFLGGNNNIEFITIASTGNATDFGNVTATTGSGLTGSVSSSTKGVTPVGHIGSVTNILEKITIASTGNGADFGDLTIARYGVGGCSNDHGGLQ